MSSNLSSMQHLFHRLILSYQQYWINKKNLIIQLSIKKKN